MTRRFNDLSTSAPFSVTALTFVEHPTDVVGTGSDTTASPTPLPMNVPVLSSSGSVSAAFIQMWNWTKDASTPTRRIFRYVATFTATDAFMNAYPGVVSLPFDVTVAVAPVKIMSRQFATSLFAIGANLLAAGAAIVYWFPPAGIMLMGMGMACLVGATIVLADANDPPVPDFGSAFRVLPDVERWKLGKDEEPKPHALRTLVLLCGKCARARAEALHARDRTWAAYIERSEDAWTSRREHVRFHLETMRRCVDAIAAAADESSSLWAELAAGVRERAGA